MVLRVIPYMYGRIMAGAEVVKLKPELNFEMFLLSFNETINLWIDDPDPLFPFYNRAAG